ncbi:MAG TPA: phosphoenolpyruvate carboxykinase (GTP) [bacterium]|nr:phosphoenolpyruvate carboxykinase (GTP) [bacterium]HOL47760.1 phosphoenolpyruvate carboxykinase (GTP) [bacterium]HPQ19363.1 phosphoenolpyruvate carboxykinase (GTP) [bacterium]
MSNSLEQLKPKLDEKSFKKLERLNNDFLFDFILNITQMCNPDNIYVSDGSEDDINYIRSMAIEKCEERKLKIEGHTIHFENKLDQARDLENTRFLVPDDEEWDEYLVKKERTAGLTEIKEIMKNIMVGKTMIVAFYILGPQNSDLSMPALQITDSFYVAHSENLLYRQGYNDFLNIKEKSRFFKFVHSAGELEDGYTKVSKNINLRRVYIDLIDYTTYSANTQYGGNTIGLKKIAMRLAIRLAVKEGWLCEHMFLMGVKGPKNRKTYIASAYPSACGKTSTAMVTGETIVGDDIIYMKIKDGNVYAINVEKGMFGIIDGVNAKDDPMIYNALRSPNEIIFSNVLVTEDNNVYWNDSGEPVPSKGINYAGEWYPGKTDAKGNKIDASHKNARFTLSLDILQNVDENLHNPAGVEVGGIIYGGRDSDTTVPVEQAFDWVHGIITKGAALESETTAATLGKTGVRKFNPMSNLEFLSIPIGRYIEANLKFGERAKKVPLIFGVNYFIKDKEGNFLNDKVDKAVWLKWIELRINNEIKAIKTPTGYIPYYEDLLKLFKEVLKKDYSPDAYEKQFTFRIPEQLSKIDRIVEIYKKIPYTPEILFKVFEEQKKRILETQSKYATNYISPFEL